MEIVHIDGKRCNFSEVKIGDVFKYKDTYYVKTQENMTLNSFSLDSQFRLYHIPQNYLVEVFPAKLTIG